jgi:hypothetical protein
MIIESGMEDGLQDALALEQVAVRFAERGVRITYRRGRSRWSGCGLPRRRAGAVAATVSAQVPPGLTRCSDACACCHL